MGIDGIGKGGGAGGLPPTPEVRAPGETTGANAPPKAFEVERSERSGRARDVDAARDVSAAGLDPTSPPTSPLARLRAGEIDVHGYVDLKVDEATAPLKGLSAEQLAEIKSALRDQMRTDPGLAELVRTATGKMPTPPED